AGGRVFVVEGRGASDGLEPALLCQRPHAVIIPMAPTTAYQATPSHTRWIMSTAFAGAMLMESTPCAHRTVEGRVMVCRPVPSSVAMGVMTRSFPSLGSVVSVNDVLPVRLARAPVPAAEASRLPVPETFPRSPTGRSAGAPGWPCG